MAKRARGSTTRPGQRARLQRGATAPRPVARPADPKPRPVTLTAEEEARAAALEAQILADEKAAEESSRRSRERVRRSAATEAPARAGSLAVRASQEYGYVARDVRRIITIGGSMVAALVGLWIVVQATGIGPF